MNNKKQKWVCNSPTMKMVCGMNTCDENMSYEQKSHKDVGICFPYTTKINCDKLHVDIDRNWKKTQTSGALFKDKELHQVDKSLKLRRL